MVKQCGELLLLPLLRCFPHTTQSLGHAPPALCRARVRLLGVLLGQRSSLPALRRWSPTFVRAVHWYYTAVRLLRDVRACLVPCGLPPRVCGFCCFRRLRGLPVLVHEVSKRVWGL